MAHAMADESEIRGWLPPRAPGGQAPPRFEPAPPEPSSPAAPAEPPAPPGPPPASAGWQPPSAESQPQAPEPRNWEPMLVPSARPESNGLAIGSIVLGVLSVGLLLMSLGTSFLFSMPMSGAAWAFGARAKQRSPEAGPAQAAVVIGMVGVGLAAAAAVIWIILFSAGFSLEDLRDYLQRKLDEQRR
jgi:hypothetical protein